MQATDIGGGRGWLDLPAAASLARVDAELGRMLDVNSAGRTVSEQEEMIALLPGVATTVDQSWHVKGLAVDSDDAYDARIVALLARHGWTVDTWEAWHLQYHPEIDQHRNGPLEESEDMRAIIQAGSPDSGIIIQAGVPPVSVTKQVFDALCGAYGLTPRTLQAWQYDTCVREQWAAFNAAHPKG